MKILAIFHGICSFFDERESVFVRSVGSRLVARGLRRHDCTPQLSAQRLRVIGFVTADL